jgi:hypothetical protein
MDINTIIAYENGDLTASETLELFSKLIVSGDAWRLQGHYGRAATYFIDNGLIDLQGNILYNDEAEL